MTGWEPEDHPRSVKSGRTNDEVRDAPAASWTGSANWAGPTADELAALDELGRAGRWTLGDHELHLTNLDKVIFPGRDGDGVADQAGPHPPPRHDGAGDAPVPRRPAGEHAPVPRRRRPQGVLAQGGPGPRPVVAPALARRGVPPSTSFPTRPASLAWLANYGAVELHPWTPRWPTRTAQRGHCSTSNPAAMTTSPVCSSWPASTAPPSTTSVSRVGPTVTGTGGSGSACRSPRATRSSRPDGGSTRCRGRSARRSAARRRRRRTAVDRRGCLARAGAVQPTCRGRRAGVGAAGVGRARRRRSASRPLDDPRRRRAPGSAPAIRWPR